MAILRLAIIYAAAYFLLLQPTNGINGGLVSGYTIRGVAYAFDSNITRLAFTPANWLDRYIRPSYWRLSSVDVWNILVSEPDLGPWLHHQSLDVNGTAVSSSLKSAG